MRVTATLLVLLLLLCHVPRAWAFLLIDQPFVFGDLELEGLRIFRNEKRGNWSLAPPAREPFRAVAAATAPGRTDLGTWNLVQNPEFPNRRLQRHLARMVCASQGPLAACRRAPDALVAASIGLFKTPGLRTLGQSAPYLHTGGKDTLEDVVAST
jgi:hypothetical protein